MAIHSSYWSTCALAAGRHTNDQGIVFGLSDTLPQFLVPWLLKAACLCIMPVSSRSAPGLPLLRANLCLGIFKKRENSFSAVATS